MVLRYAQYESFSQHDKDYKPFDVPSTVREAIIQQRVLDDAADAASADRVKSNEQQQAAEAANDAAKQHEDDLKDQAAKAEQDAQIKEGQLQAKAQEARELAEATLAQKAVARSKVDYACRLRARQAADDAASRAAGDGSGRDTNDVFHRVKNGFHCAPE